MGRLRIRWSALARWLAGALALLLVPQLLPALLRPPPPRPLAADIGLPAARPATRPPPIRRARVWAARVVAAPRPAVRRPPPRRAPAGSSAPAPAPPETAIPPPPATPPSPPPAAPEPPPPPEDGSAEFAPH